MPGKFSMAALGLAACGWIAPAAAQAIYRCGDSYSQQACAGGARVQAEDPRTAGQRSQTTLAVERDAKAADAMEKARLKEEDKPVQAYIPPAKVQDGSPDDASMAKPAAGKKPDRFAAVAPKKPGQAKARKKKKAKKPAA
jgi:hypothetical protein